MMNNTIRIPRRRRQRGVGMIEVLVAVLVLSVGMLGVAGMQLSALRSNQSAYERSVATILASSIAERMAANRASAQKGDYNLAMGGAACPAPGGGSLAKQDLTDWITQMRGTGVLGETSCGSVQCNVLTGVCVVTVQWSDSRSVVSGTETYQLVLEVRL